tara:strand:+ start:382 stop:570 length:189 start_codon:yes stop_codon:yes gene_type:complete
MKKKKSPCISICKFSGPNQWCIGCGLTLKEYKKWKGLKPFDRTKLENELKQRLIKINLDKKK